MIITCQNCKTGYNLDPVLLASTGSRVRCSNCGNVFVAYPSAVEEPADAPESELLSSGAAATAVDFASAAVESEPDATVKVEAPGDAPQDQPLGFDPEHGDVTQGVATESLFDEETEKSLAGLDEETLAGLDEASLEEMGRSLEQEDGINVLEFFAPENEEDQHVSSVETAEASDLDLDLDLDLGDGEPEAAAEASDLDLDLNFDLEDDEKVETAGTDEGSDLELGLDLDLEYEAPSATVETAGASDLDLDLDLGDGEPEAAAEASDLELDLNFDLEDDEKVETAGTELVLDDGQKAHAAETQELELDLDFDLDDGQKAPASEAEAAELELDLDLDLGQAATGKPHEDGTNATADFQDEELDLSDIEKMLETGEGLDLAGTAGGSQVEPTLDVNTAHPAAIEVTPGDDADLIKTLDSEADTTLFDEDMDKEAAADEEEIAAYAETYELGAVPQHLGQEPSSAATETAPGQDESRPKVKKKSGKSLVAVLVLLLVGGGVYGAHMMGIQIPFVSSLLGGQVADDAGNLKISTFGIDSRFIENATAGRLFVITGKVRNDYDQPRGLIQVSGKLYAKGKKLVATENVFCGNLLADLDLAKLDIAEIKKRLKISAGANKSNLNLAPGGVVPFMVVFSSLPVELEEFTIEVVNSQ